MLLAREEATEDEDVTIGNMIEELLEVSAATTDDDDEFTGKE